MTPEEEAEQRRLMRRLVELEEEKAAEHKKQWKLVWWFIAIPVFTWQLNPLLRDYAGAVGDGSAHWPPW